MGKNFIVYSQSATCPAHLIRLDLTCLINNAVEGWNNKVNSYFERPEPNIKKYRAVYTKKQKIAAINTYMR
jgi:hypothetical protein